MAANQGSAGSSWGRPSLLRLPEQQEVGRWCVRLCVCLRLCVARIAALVEFN